MRFMMLMLPGQYESPGKGSVEAMRAMGHFNEELQKAGVLVSLDGLHPASSATRVTFVDGMKTGVTDGPFAEAKEVVGGYWIIQAKSQAEAVEWASRAPVYGDATIEVRKLYEFGDFPAEFRETSAEEFPEMAARRQRLSERE